MGNDAAEHRDEQRHDERPRGRDREPLSRDRADGGRPTPDSSDFDADSFITGLDAIFAAHDAPTEAEPYLVRALNQAEEAGDEAGMLTVLNETMGFYRSQGRHDDNLPMIRRALDLATRMRLQGTDVWTTTLINAATGMRAAQCYEEAENLYTQALESAARTYSPHDRRMAALHNNLSMLYSATGRLRESVRELEHSLAILNASSTDPEADIDVASTHTNLALVLLQLGATNDDAAGGEQGAQAGSRRDLLRQALTHATRALAIYRHGHLEHSAHYASALAGYAQVCFASGRFDEAVETYRRALSVIEECYGKDTDYHRITEDNLQQAEQARQAQNNSSVEQAAGSDGAATSSGTGTAHTADDLPGTGRPITGLALARAYWNAYGKPLIANRYPRYRSRIAAGLVGQGSECWGFDDAHSRDHDFGPGFCLWLTDEDYAAIGEDLQADYEALPQTFMGYGPREATARAQGQGRRVGVFEIGEFFGNLTGYPQAPNENSPHEWLMLDEATLSAATNGMVFADPLGAFSKTRQGFKLMPEDVRLALISQRLGMIAQAGQYNLPRSLSRDDGAAAWLSIGEFTNAVASLVFLLNQPVTVGYLPYYKWRFKALRKLSSRMAARLPGVCERLESLLRLSSAACFGGVGFGEGGKGSSKAARAVNETVDVICSRIVAELRSEGLTPSGETFLEWQRPYIEEHIVSDAACLHSLPASPATSTTNEHKEAGNG